MTVLIGSASLCLLLVLLYETNILYSGIWVDDAGLQFYFLSVMEVVTLAIIPLALYLFKIKRINRELTGDDETAAKALQKWGCIRLLMLCVPMVVCTLLYYMFVAVAFAYLSIIFFLSLFFILPTLSRCVEETGFGGKSRGKN